MPPQPNPGTSGTRPVRRVRRKPPPPSTEARKNAAYGSRPARPIRSTRPIRAPRVVRAVSPGGDTKSDVHAGQDFKTTAPYRGAVVAAYSTLSGHEKHQRVAQAASRVRQGSATEADHAILHAHRTRVAGNRERAAAAQAFNVINPSQSADRILARVQPAKPPPGVKEFALPKERHASIGQLITGIGKASSKGWKIVHAPKVIQNVPTDVAELAVTTPSSIAKLGSDIVHHPGKVPGEIVAPYKELYHHPGKFIESHPVSAALMVAPAARMPGRAVGKVARVAGKQTLERPAATFPGTNLREARTGSRDFVVRAKQARTDRRKGAPQMTEKQVGTRVDEFYDAAKRREQGAMAEAQVQARERQLSGDEVTDHLKRARKRAEKQTNREFAREFGGGVHATRDAAQAAAADLPFEATVRKVRGGYTNAPKFAVRRLTAQRKVGSSKAIGSKVMRTANRMFAGAVLPTSPRWLAGQGFEAGLRSAVAGAGPTSLLREAKVYRRLERESPGAGEAFRARTSGGGQFGPTSTARQFMEGRMTLAETFKDTPLEKPARGATRVGAVPGIRHVREGYREYSRIVMDTVNGAIETTARKAMTGQAIKQGPLLERSLLGLTDKAIDDAARGLKATEAQVAVGRQVHRAYGQYSAFSAAKRETLLHSTPFFPWYRNTVTFLLKVLPVDHPMHAALVADLDAATEDWRKAHGLSFRGGQRLPDFLQGRYPVGKEGGTVPVGRYLPFAPADIAGSAADLVFPAFSGPLLNLRGVEWTGEKLKGKPVPSAALTAAETFVPGLAQSDRVVGVSRVVRKAGRKGTLQGVPLGQSLRREFDPFVATESPTKVVRRKGARPVPLNPLLKPVKVRRVKVLPLG